MTSRIMLSNAGSSKVETSVTMRNDAPTGPASELLGDGSDVPVGWWGVDVEIYLPTEAISPKVRVTGQSLSGIDEAYGHPLADAFLFADPGASSTATVTYDDPDAAVEGADVWTYRTQVRPQPSLRPIAHTIELELPGGAQVVSMPPGSVVNDGTIRWEGAPTSATELVVVYSLAA